MARSDGNGRARKERLSEGSRRGLDAPRAKSQKPLYAAMMREPGRSTEKMRANGSGGEGWRGLPGTDCRMKARG